MTDDELLAFVRRADGLREKRRRKRERRKTKDLRKKKLVQDAVKRCHWCRMFLTDASATIEHLIPIEDGGSTVGTNVRWACKECNNARVLEAKA